METIKVITEQNASPIMIYAHFKSAEKLKGSINPIPANECWQDHPEAFQQWVMEQLGAEFVFDVVILDFEELEEVWSMDQLQRHYESVKEWPWDSIENEIGKIDLALGHVEIGKLGIAKNMGDL